MPPANPFGAREAAVDVLLAQLRVALGALDALGDEAGLAHDAQVVEEVDLLSSRPASCVTWVHQDSPLRARKRTGFDIWVVNVAAPSLQRDLHVSDAALQLIVGGYAFMYASGMVTGGPLAFTFTMMSILGPRLSARFGARSITIGAGLAALGTIAMAVTGVRYSGHLTGWDLAPATALIGLGQGMALPSLIGAALSHVPPDRAGAAPGIHTTTQQFGAASGVAVIGAVFYGRLGDVPSRGGSVSAMVLAMVIDAVIVLAVAGLTLLLPQRAAGRPGGGPLWRRRSEPQSTPVKRSANPHPGS